MYRTLIAGLLLIVSGCCKESYQGSVERNISFRAKADEVFDNNVVIIPNARGDVAVMYPNPKISNRDPMPTLNIVIYNRETDEVLHRTTAVRGSVKWYSEEEVHILSAPGQISRDQPMDKGYYFNVYTKETRK